MDGVHSGIEAEDEVEVAPPNHRLPRTPASHLGLEIQGTVSPKGEVTKPRTIYVYCQQSEMHPVSTWQARGQEAMQVRPSPDGMLDQVGS